LADDKQIRNGFEPARVFLEREVRDAINRTTVEETDIEEPEDPVAANSAYSLWSIELTEEEDNVRRFTIGAEDEDGVKISTVVTHSVDVDTLPPCVPAA
jgi:hypothetical protein